MDITDIFNYLHQFILLGCHVDIILGWVITIIMVAKIFCAATPTPSPIKYPIWSKIYTVIEYLGLIVGYVKDIPLTTIEKEVIQVVTDITTKPPSTTVTSTITTTNASVSPSLIEEGTVKKDINLPLPKSQILSTISSNKPTEIISYYDIPPYGTVSH